ncbi:MAG: Hemerythrin cation binding domain protein [Myxococcales bacterium]|nr:Hemerythrin cation binding domain protein [Myxococcales bacterium]
MRASAKVTMEDTEVDVESPASRPVDALELLTQQHRVVQELFDSVRDRSPAFYELLENLSIHVEIEELVFYPMLRELGLAEQMLESVEEHLTVKRLIADLVDDVPLDEETRAAKLRIMQREVEQHIEREEREIFPAVQRQLGDDELIAIAELMIDAMVSLLDEGDEAPLEQLLSQTAC